MMLNHYTVRYVMLDENPMSWRNWPFKKSRLPWLLPATDGTLQRKVAPRSVGDHFWCLKVAVLCFFFLGENRKWEVDTVSKTQVFVHVSSSFLVSHPYFFWGEFVTHWSWGWCRDRVQFARTLRIIRQHLKRNFKQHSGNQHPVLLYFVMH